MLLYGLRRDWCELLAPFGAGEGEVAAAWSGLVAAYSDPNRHYHNLQHVALVLETLERFRDLVHDRTSLRLAAWYHDAVYDSKSHDNEEQSAALARQVLPRLLVPPAVSDRVADLIRMTKHHRAPSGDLDAAVFFDADLAILGAVTVDYDDYAHAIRREYAWVPEADYRAGRRAVLQCFLQRDRIFQTETLFQSLEGRARQNLQREIVTFGGS